MPGWTINIPNELIILIIMDININESVNRSNNS